MLRRFAVAGISFEVEVAEALAEVLAEQVSGFESAVGADPQGVSLHEGTPSLRRADRALEVTAFAVDLGPALRGVLTVGLDQRDGGLLHGAGVVVDGEGILCIAPSEGGKTTLCGKLAGRAPVLSDETIAIRLDGPAPRIGGTFFWSGPALPSAPGMFPLVAVCFLRKGAMEVRPMPRAQAVQELLSEWHLPERPAAAVDALERADRLLRRVHFYALSTTLQGDPLPLLHELLVRGRPSRSQEGG